MMWSINPERTPESGFFLTENWRAAPPILKFKPEFLNSTRSGAVCGGGSLIAAFGLKKMVGGLASEARLYTCDSGFERLTAVSHEICLCSSAWSTATCTPGSTATTLQLQRGERDTPARPRISSELETPFSHRLLAQAKRTSRDPVCSEFKAEM